MIGIVLVGYWWGLGRREIYGFEVNVFMEN